MGTHPKPGWDTSQRVRGSLWSNLHELNVSIGTSVAAGGWSGWWPRLACAPHDPCPPPYLCAEHVPVPRGANVTAGGWSRWGESWWPWLACAPHEPCPPSGESWWQWLTCAPHEPCPPLYLCAQHVPVPRGTRVAAGGWSGWGESWWPWLACAPHEPCPPSNQCAQHVQCQGGPAWLHGDGQGASMSQHLETVNSHWGSTLLPSVSLGVKVGSESGLSSSVSQL